MSYDHAAIARRIMAVARAPHGVGMGVGTGPRAVEVDPATMERLLAKAERVADLEDQLADAHLLIRAIVDQAGGRLEVSRAALVNARRDGVAVSDDPVTAAKVLYTFGP